MIAGIIVAAAEEQIDRTPSWIWPEGYEIYFGGAAAITIFGLLAWKVLPLARKALNGRTERIRAQLEEAAETKERADREAEEIRRAKGDIDAERARLLGEADEQAAALVADGRERLDREVAELDAKASADIAAASAREVGELRAEIARTAALVSDRVVVDTLDDQTQQQLIENFIQRVGATGSTS
jgi:F-type H+-transporting ATPase subunit b